MTVHIDGQDFFIYVPDKECSSEALPLLSMSVLTEPATKQAQHIAVDDQWVKIFLQDHLVVYARLGNDVEV